MKIKGKVTQIIEPKKISNMIPNRPDLPIWDFKNTHYIITIIKLDYPKNYFKKVFYNIKNRNKEYIWSFATIKSKYKIGDVIKVDLKHYYKKTELYQEAV